MLCQSKRRHLGSRNTPTLAGTGLALALAWVELCLVAASRACSSVSNRTVEKPGPELSSARRSRPERPLLWRAVRGRGAGRQLRREAAQRSATGAAPADA